MMIFYKYFNTLLLALVISIAGNIRVSFAQERISPDQYPGLKRIAELFVMNFPLNEFTSDVYKQFNFIKDPAGWKVQTKLPQELELMLWSSSSGFPDYIDTLSNKEVLLTGLIDNLSLYEYSIYPFYGYPEWKDDVIELFKKRDPQELSDNELYGYGRAYSLKASDILWSHSLYSDISEAQGEEARRRDINRYLDYSEEAILAFKLLLTRSPHYKTYVGMMDVKYSNEVVARFYELQLFGFQKEARKLLWEHNPENLYDSFWNSYAKSILSMADKNAIVFTNGDNDTYPLLWMQEVLGYRKDVTIVNLSLLNDPQYITLLEKYRPGNYSLGTGFTDQQLDELNQKIILLDSPDEIQENHFFLIARQRLIKNLDLDTDIITYEPGSYLTTYVNNMGLIDTILFYTGPPGKILSNAEFLVRTIIHEQAGKNSFYFTKGMQEKFKDIFGYEQMKDQGLVYKIEKPSGNVIYLDGHPYDIEALSTLVSTCKLSIPEPEFYSRKIIHDFIIESSMILLFAQNYDLAEDTMNNRMKSFMDNFSPQKTGINFYFPFVAAQLYKSESDRDFVMKKIESFLDILKTNIIDNEIKDDNPRDIDEMKYYQSVISYLKGKSFMHESDNLIKRLEEMEEIIKNRLLEFPELNFG